MTTLTPEGVPPMVAFTIWWNYQGEAPDDEITVYLAVPGWSPWKDAANLGLATVTVEPEGDGEMLTVRLTAKGREIAALDPFDLTASAGSRP